MLPGFTSACFCIYFISQEFFKLLVTKLEGVFSREADKVGGWVYMFLATTERTGEEKGRGEIGKGSSVLLWPGNDKT